MPPLDVPPEELPPLEEPPPPVPRVNKDAKSEEPPLVDEDEVALDVVGTEFWKKLPKSKPIVAALALDVEIIKAAIALIVIVFISFPSSTKLLA